MLNLIRYFFFAVLVLIASMGLVAHSYAQTQYQFINNVDEFTGKNNPTAVIYADRVDGYPADFNLQERTPFFGASCERGEEPFLIYGLLIDVHRENKQETFLFPVDTIQIAVQVKLDDDPVMTRKFVQQISLADSSVEPIVELPHELIYSDGAGENLLDYPSWRDPFPLSETTRYKKMAVRFLTTSNDHATFFMDDIPAEAWESILRVKNECGK